MSSSQAGKIDVAYVAQLARLQIDQSCRQELQQDMEAIVEYINFLGEVDVTGVEPTAHAVVKTNVWREDVARPGTDRSKMLSNAPAIIDENLIRVPQVLPGEGMS